MEFDRFPDLFKQQLAQALRGPLRSLLEDAPDLRPDATYTWHESCRVLTLDLPKGFSIDDSVTKFVRDQDELWHHQIKVDGQPILYARSTIKNERCHLVQLTRSVLAERFDATLDQLESIAMDWTVRLLQIPRFDDEIFGVFDGDALKGCVPLRETGSTERALPTEHAELTAPTALLSPSSVLENLQSRPPAQGLSS